MSAVFTAAIWAAFAQKAVDCPNHGGAFDCTPFCEKCEGAQEVKVSV